MEPVVAVRFGRVGADLVGVATVQCGAGAPEVVTARVNEQELYETVIGALALRAREQGASPAAVGGFFKRLRKKIKKAVRKVAKGKVMRAIGKGVKKVMRNKFTKLVVSATAVAFPAVGVPAAAAFTAANKVIDKVEAGNKAARSAVRKLSRAAKKPGRAGAKARKAAKILAATNSWRQGLKVAEARQLAAKRRKRPTAAQLARLRSLTPAQLAALRRMQVRGEAVGGPLEITLKHDQSAAVSGEACGCG